MSLAGTVAAGALAWGASLVAVQGVACVRALRTRRVRWAEGTHGAVLLVRPCAGVEPALAENLRSTARARWGGPVRVRFAVAQPDDPALPVCATVAEELVSQGVDARVVLTRAEAPNQKAAQLAAVVDHEDDPPALVMVADSDTDLSDLPLGALLARLEGSPQTAAIWVPPVERAGETAGDRASRAVLGASLHAFPLLGCIDADGLVGKLFAARAEHLAAVGGFGALGRHLGEDMELARAWRARGYALEMAPFVVPSSAAGRSWDDAAARYARWMTVIRAQRRTLLGSYPALFFGSAPWTLLAGCTALAAPVHAPALAVMGLGVWGARTAVAAVGAHCAGLAFSPGDIARSDALLATSFVRALRSRTFAWRGRTLSVQPDGSLVEG